jgi:hypothetical protein
MAHVVGIDAIELFVNVVARVQLAGEAVVKKSSRGHITSHYSPSSHPPIPTMHIIPLAAPSLAANYPPCNPQLKGRKICMLDYDGQIVECNGIKWVKAARCPYPQKCYYDGEMYM